MENRFGVKDFFLFLVLAVLIVLVILGMFQYDRQWTLIQQDDRQLNDLTGEVSTIHRILQQGGAFTAGAATQPVQLTGFEEVYKAQAQSDYAEGDDLVLTSQAQPDKLTPLINQDEFSQVLQGYVMDSLLGMDPNTLAWEPNLAESFHVSDDALTIDFTLRRGITFSDGSPFTADDVVYTFETAKNPAIEAPAQQSLLDKLAKIEKIDDYHVRFHFSEPYFKSVDTAGMMPIMSKAFYSHYSPTEFNRSTGLLIGTGPYRMADPTSWKPEPGKPLEMVRNERYWGPRPSFNKLVWRIIENPAARATAFANGETDVYGIQDMGPSAEQYDKMLADPNVVARSQHFAMDSLLLGYVYVGWNEKIGRDGPPSYFADARVRRAMTMLIDRDAIIRSIVHGHGSVASGPFHPMNPQADPNIKPWPYDPAAGQKLLAEAGFTRNGDQLLGPDGKPFEFKLMYPTAGAMMTRCVPMIRDNLAQAGILVTPDPQEWSVFLKRKDDRQFDADIAAWGTTPHDDLYQIFDSFYISGVGDDYIQYKNPQLDAAIEKARVTRDDKARLDLWHDCSKIINEDQPYTFLFNNQELNFLDKRIRNVRPTRSGINPLQEWYVPKTLQKHHD